MDSTTNENAVWAYSNTGNLVHAFLQKNPDGRLRAACRSTITREANATLHEVLPGHRSDAIGGQLCKSCETRWNAHVARVERERIDTSRIAEFRAVADAAAYRVTSAPDATDPEWRAALDQLGEALDYLADADPLYAAAVGQADAERVTFTGTLTGVAPATKPTSLQQSAHKTIIKAETTWMLQSRDDSASTWAYVSDHGSEQDATHRAQAFLIDGCRRQFRVVEYRTEILATDPIEPPKDEEAGDRFVVRPLGATLFGVIDTHDHNKAVTSGCSRYGAQYIRDGLNDGSMALDSTGTVVSAETAAELTAERSGNKPGPDLRWLANRQLAAPETIAEIHAERHPDCKGAGCPACGWTGRKDT